MNVLIHLRMIVLVLIGTSVACGSTHSTPTPDGGDTDDGDTDTLQPMSEPITDLTDSTWTFVPFPNALCRDGSSTGIGINPRSTSTKLMIYMEGGGACFNATTCSGNRFAFDATTFASANLNGVLDRDDPSNAFNDWNLVYVPYCTGDVHSGNAHDVVVAGVTSDQPAAQQFVGYTNMTAYLERLAPTFSQTSQVVLLGTSAGGFGATANYLQTADAFSSATVDLIDDSGPYMESPYLATCLQQQWHSLWGWDATVLRDCGADCVGQDSPLISVLEHIGRVAPERLLGLVESTADSTITSFFGYGASNCTSFAKVTPADFETGLLAIRAKMAFDVNFGAYIFAGTNHTSLVNSLDSRETSGVKLSDWVDAFAAGTVTNVGP